MEKESFTSPDVSHCFLRASRSHFIDDSIFKGRAPMDQLRVRTLGGVNSFLDRKCSEVSGRFVWGPSYLADNGSQLQWRGCVAGPTYRFLASVERAPVEDWPVYFVRIAEPTDLSRAPSPEFAAYLERRGFVAPEDLTSADWARTSVEEERRMAGHASAAERTAQDRDRAGEAEKRRLAHRDRKILVGARVCLEKQGLTYFGFTEQCSAQTDKIQIRVTGTSNRMLAYTPEIIWDRVDNWALCDQ